MGTFIFVLLVIFIILSVLLMISSWEGSIVGFVMFVILFGCGVAIPYTSHNSDIANIENSQAIIKIQEDYKDRLNSQLNSMPKIDGSLMNGDSPYKSIVSEIAVAEQKIASANERVLESRIDIQKRERGLTSYIIWFF